MICDFGDVVVVPFPFVDAQVVKHRPALVLSNRVFNASSGQSVLAMITSANQSTWPTDLEIADLEQAGLKHYSVVRWKIRGELSRAQVFTKPAYFVKQV